MADKIIYSRRHETKKQAGAADVNTLVLDIQHMAQVYLRDMGLDTWSATVVLAEGAEGGIAVATTQSKDELITRARAWLASMEQAGPERT